MYMDRLNKTEPAIFISLMCSLLSEDLHSELFYIRMNESKRVEALHSNGLKNTWGREVGLVKPIIQRFNPRSTWIIIIIIMFIVIIIIIIIITGRVNSNFPYRWSPASLTFNNYFYLFLYLYIT